MSEKEQQQYKTETGKRPLYFNKPSNDFKKWLEKKVETERRFQEENIKMNKKAINTKQINLRGEFIENRMSKRRRKYQRFQKNTTIQVDLIQFFKKR